MDPCDFEDPSQDTIEPCDRNYLSRDLVEPCYLQDRPRYPMEPCGAAACWMADETNCNFHDDYKMATADEHMMRNILDMYLDRPCPLCKSDVIDKPQCDLRQCRACEHVWGLDDTQTLDSLEEFVREYAQMEPCQKCGTDGLDDFEVVERYGEQEVFCLKCRTTQTVKERPREENYDIDRREPEGQYGMNANLLNDLKPNEAVDLECPSCPGMTYAFFEKEFERGRLVRAVCPGCSTVVFITDEEASARKTRMFQMRDGQQRFDPFPPHVKTTLKRLMLKPVQMLGHTGEAEGQGLVEGDDVKTGGIRDMAKREFPRMGEQIGWTIGSALGNAVVNTEEGALATGTVGKMFGQRIGDWVAQSVARRRNGQAVNGRQNGQAVNGRQNGQAVNGRQNGQALNGRQNGQALNH